MSGPLRIDGDAGGAVKAFTDIERSVTKMDEALAKATKGASDFEKGTEKVGKAGEVAAKSQRQMILEAQKIKEALDPQERLNRKYAELQQHVNAGRLSMSQATAEGIKLRQAMYDASEEGKRAADQAAADAEAKKKAIKEEAAAQEAAAKREKQNADARAAARKRAIAAAEQEAEAHKKLLAQGEKIKQSLEDPTERYKREVLELGKALRKGAIDKETFIRGVRNLKTELEQAGDAGKQAFGAGALQNIGQMALGVMGVSSALGLVAAGFRAVNEEQNKAAENAMRSRMGIGQLSQLAASATDENGKITPASQAAAMKSLVDETDKYHKMGAAEDRNAAANLTFDLNSSGLSEEDRYFAAQLRARGVLQDVAGLGQAYDASVTALGVKEVGTFEQFASKAIAAGSVSPGTIQALPLALTKAGADAKKLGMSDEFLFSSGAYLAKESGSPDEGGTKMAALLAGMNKSGIDFTGMSGAEMIDRLSQENTGYGGIFKDNREAVNAFGTVRDNLAAIRALEGNVFDAQSQGLARQSLQLPNVDAPTGAANAAAIETARYEEEITKRYGERESLSDAIRTAEGRSDITSGRWWPQRAFNRAANATTDFLGGDDFLIRSAQTIEQNNPGTYSQETMDRIDKYLEKNTQLLEQQNKLLEEQNQVMRDDSGRRAFVRSQNTRPARP